MNRYLVAMFWGSLFYVEYRYGLTMNRVFVVVFLISAAMSVYYIFWLLGSALVGLKSSKLLLQPIFYYRRKTFIWVTISTMAFYGFYRTQIPGQLETYKTIIVQKLESFAPEQEPMLRRNDDSKMNLASGNGAERSGSRASSPAKPYGSKEMIREITTGWNTATADTEGDNFNWEKATDLVKKYPDYIHNSRGYKARATEVLKEPWEYYGKVLRFTGFIYSIQQLPPDNSVAQFFDGNCYHAMVVVNDHRVGVPISAYIVGRSEGVAEDSAVSVKGYVFGQSRLMNNAGNVSLGLAFVGFRE